MNEKQILLPESLVFSKRIYLSIFFSAVSFALPLFLTHPQPLLGTFVNALLLLSATFLPFSLALPVALMPSLAALSRGLLFGPLTPLLYYMVPSIWLGNLFFIFCFKRLRENKSYFVSVFWAAVAKTTVLFLPALLLVKIKILPPLFLQTMGSLQFFTAISGGILTLFLFRFWQKFNA